MNKHTYEVYVPYGGWVTIHHKLGTAVQVSVYTLDGEQLLPTIRYADSDTVEITLSGWVFYARQDGGGGGDLVWEERGGECVRLVVQG